MFRDIFKILGRPLDNKYYENDKMLKQFIESINFVIEDNLLSQVIKSPYYSLLFDESMDTSKTEQLIIYVRFYDCDKKKFVTSFLKILSLENQQGVTIYLKIKELLNELGLDLMKCMSIVTDGAYNMTGVNKGVFACFQKDNPFIQKVHCANHKLALAAVDTNKELPFLKDYIVDISNIYNFFSRSAKRNILLRKYQLQTCEPHLNILKMSATRWLSLSHCVKNITRTYGAIILAIDEEYNDINPNNETAEKEQKKLRELLDRIGTYKFIAFTYYLSDILQIIENLCLEFPNDEVGYLFINV